MKRLDTEALASLIASMDFDDCVKAWEEISDLYTVTSTIVCVRTVQKHQTCGDENCEISYGEAVVDRVVKNFLKELMLNVRLNCEVNGFPFSKSPNADVAREIKKEFLDG